MISVTKIVSVMPFDLNTTLILQYTELCLDGNFIWPCNNS